MQQSENFSSASSAIASEAKPIMVIIDPEIQDLIPDFLTNRHKDIQDLWDAYHHKNYAKIKIIAHRIKGIGGGYGFTTISEIGCALEQAVFNLDANSIPTLLHNFEYYLEHVQIVYQEI